MDIRSPTRSPHSLTGSQPSLPPVAARKGRGAQSNPTGRFERFQIEPDPEDPDPARRTELLPDPSRTALTFNQSPDIPFDASLNPYRGCEHGCAYCYARPTHEYLGFSAGLDFETKILVKERAPELLRRELSAPRWVPQVVALSGVTDAYQPIERKLELTRRCVAVFAEFRNPITIITKNALVTRDIDLLQELARYQARLGLALADDARPRDPAHPRAAGVVDPRAPARDRSARAGGHPDRRAARSRSSRASRTTRSRRCSRRRRTPGRATRATSCSACPTA